MFKILALFSLLICTTAAAKARVAVFSNDAKVNWPFAGPARLIDTRIDLGSLLHVRDRCIEPLKKVSEAVNRYGYAASYSDPREARSAREQIARALKDSAKRDCKLEGDRAYVVSSLSLLSQGGWEYKPPTRVVMVGSLPPGLIAALFGTYLTDRGKVSLVDFDQSAPRKILSGYACENSDIFLSRELAPIDLATELIHEMGHLLHEKFPEKPAKPFDETQLKDALFVIGDLFGAEEAALFQETWQTAYRTNILAVRDIAPLLLDETLAVIQSSLRQVALQDAANKPEIPAFRLPDDITLFTRDGPLQTLWKQSALGGISSVTMNVLGDFFGGRRDVSSPEQTLFTQTYFDFMDARVQRMPEQARSFYLRVRNWQTVYRPLKPEVEEIYRRVLAGHFPRLRLDDRLKAYINPAYWSRKEDGLGTRIEAIYDRYQKFHPSPSIKADFTLPGFVIDLDRTVKITELILEELKSLGPTLLTEAPACTEFLGAVADGRLAEYIGAGLRRPLKPGDGGAGMRPDGGAGMRPDGGAGMRPSVALPYWP